MHVIALIGNKGGAGKTTLCVNLAVALGNENAVAILDADPQQSSSQWHNVADGNGSGVRVIESCEGIEHTVDNLEDQFSYCLIDCPPSVHSRQMQQALRVADLAIVPVQPSPVDLWATVHVEDEVTLARKVNPALKAFLLINQFESRTQLSQIMRRALAELSIPAAETQIKRRVIYRSSFMEGRTVNDIGRRGAAAAEEIHQLILEMEKYL